MISHWLESRALLVQSKTSGMSLSEPISLCALEIITFIAWIAGLGRRGGGVPYGSFANMWRWWGE